MRPLRNATGAPRGLLAAGGARLSTPLTDQYFRMIGSGDIGTGSAPKA